MSETSAIVLAAGKSTRMKSERAKVLHEICGRPMLKYVLDACRLAGVDRIVVVVGHDKERVRERFGGDDQLTWVEQAEQRGTGHAVACCRKALKGFSGSVLVVAGDMPLVRRAPLAQLLEERAKSGVALTLATAELDDPSGYGRIVRDDHGRLASIVEDRACNEDERAIREVNPSYYCFDAKQMFASLDEVRPSGGSGEYYLTDVVAVLRRKERGVSATVKVSAEDAMGVNSRLDLATVGRVMQDRIQFALMTEGVTIVDPDNTWIESDVAIGADSVIYPFSFVEAGATVGAGCRVGPFAVVRSRDAVGDGQCVGPCKGIGG